MILLNISTKKIKITIMDYQHKLSSLKIENNIKDIFIHKVQNIQKNMINFWKFHRIVND